jgi:histidine ammonia-lyase
VPKLSRQPVSIADVVAVARGGERVALTSVAERDLAASRAIVEAVLADDVPVYGLTTELGAGRDIRLAAEQLADFQRRTLRNSSGGIGEPLSDAHARATIFTRLVGFTRGGAGVTPALAHAYTTLLNDGPLPYIPRTGSVGAADLTHLAAIASAVDHEFQPHEALAALSGNAYSVGVGALVIDELARLVTTSDVVVALSVSALRAHTSGGSASPFSAPIQSAHRSVGQAASAARIRAHLDDAEVASTQDPVSFRSAPQVNGTLAEAVTAAAAAVTLELNSRTENPLVDLESGSMVSGGNFQVLGLALAYEQLRLALAHVAVTSERRLSSLSGIGAGFRRSGATTVPGLLWYSGAALVSELRHLANPVTLAAPSLSESVEDHSSNAAVALQLLERSVRLTRTVLAIEAVSAVELLWLADDAPLVPRTAELVAALVELLESGAPAHELIVLAESILEAAATPPTQAALAAEPLDDEI